MADRRVLVTGARVFASPRTVRAVLRRARGATPAGSMLLVHGQCDPRDPRTGSVIPWGVAVNYPHDVQLRLLGADWLADRIADVEFGWRAERHAVVWGHRGAGPVRNARMVSAGAGEGHALMSPGVRHRGTLGCAELMAAAGIPVSFWCERCPARPAPAPCEVHMTGEVVGSWRKRAGALRAGTGATLW